jgi:hypothetical protein
MVSGDSVRLKTTHFFLAHCRPKDVAEPSTFHCGHMPIGRSPTPLARELDASGRRFFMPTGSSDRHSRYWWLS